MKRFRINSVKDIESAVWVMYRHLPYPSISVSSSIAQVFPYLMLAIAGYILSIAIVPFFLKNYVLDPLLNTGLYNFNILLSRILFLLIAVIIATSFDKLSQRSLRGWYTMFFVSLFHTFMVLVVFNIYSLLALVIFWYLLFAIKPRFS